MSGRAASPRAPEATRRKILEAAFVEFYANGFQGGSLNHIVDAAGTTKGALFHHFDSKQELGYAVMDDIVGPLLLARWLEPVANSNDPISDIQHAFRVTVRATNGHVYPASHSAGSTSGALPMGARLRLRAAKDISGFTPEVQKVFRAMKTYGLIVADNGSDMFVTGTFDTRWNNDILNPAFYALTASDFEVVQLGWNPGNGQVSLDSLAVTPASVVGGQSSTGIVTLSGPAPGTGVTVTLSSTNPAVAGVPPSVTVAAGVSSTSFSITTFAVASSTPVDIIGSAGGATRTATLTVTPPPLPTLSSLMLSPSTVTGGSTSTGTVTLSGPAPAGGALVELASSKPALAAVPPNVTVAAGTSSASFTVSTGTAPSNTSAVISASYNGSAKTATLTIRKRKR